MEMTITHKKYGIGIVKKIDKKNKKFIVDFGGFYDLREVFLVSFDSGNATSTDATVLKAVNAMRRKVVKENPRALQIHGITYGMDSFFTGGVAEDISCSSEELFEAIGYIAKNAKFVEAEVSQSRVEIFEEMFHTKECYIHNDADNNRNQFRIDFARTENMPRVLEANLIEACGCGRIAKSLFVERLVKDYGFKFGASQNVAKIREIAVRYKYDKAFDRGFNL